ncbi:NAD(P)H-dependent oxidoreductase [Paenibacillus polymyxa]|uniref:NAD(P)H-dependent oxidoreductase n=1 Tax=Paenibacillus polymyxa TaxID=1406 RepID=UPI003B685ACB
MQLINRCEKYQTILKDRKELIVVSPIWWYQFPAIVKGFIDKVMLKNFSYTDVTNFIGLLTHIAKATIITTGEASEKYLREEARNYLGCIYYLITALRMAYGTL